MDPVHAIRKSSVGIENHLELTAHCLQQVAVQPTAPLLRTARETAEVLWTSLIGQFELEQTLIPRADRILGEGLEEITAMSEQEEGLITALERFMNALEEAEARHHGGHDVDAEVLIATFAEFAVLYDQHLELSREFFHQYAALLYPSVTQSE